jgi:hypothetical protein
VLKLKIIKNEIPNLNKKIQAELNKLPRETYKVFVKNTPKRSGNARSKTKLKGTEIIADYPYAHRLNEGWSKQAPDGIVKPTEQYLLKRLKRIFTRK